MKPILFNTEMVKAILAGRKTVTRRIAFPNDDLQEFDCTKYPNGWWFRGRAYKSWQDVQYDILPLCKYKVGDVLYVRETWCKGSLNGGAEQYFYKADDNDFHCRWKPSIHMPKEAARIFLQAINVKVEQLWDITEQQAILEGIRIGMGGLPYFSCRDAFAGLWNSTIKKSDLDKYGWDANPWVFVISFERVLKDEAMQ